jgi:hypothetical protein
MVTESSHLPKLMPGIGQGHKRETPFKSSNTLWETKNIQDTTPAL